MKLKLLTAAATAALMAAPSVAIADDEGWYLRGNAGYGMHTDMDHTGILTGDVESEGNVAGSLGIGYDLGTWRLEVDGTTLWTDMGKISQSPSSFSKFRSNTLMLNALYDFEDFGAFAPYVGAGVGVVMGQLDAGAHGFLGSQGAYITHPNCTATQGCSVREDDTSTAWQLIAGLGYDISDRLVWDTQYRYQDFGTLDFDARSVSAAGLGTDVQSGASLHDAGAHMIMTGLRYKLGASSPMVTCWDGSEAKMIGKCPVQPVMVTCWDGSSFEEGTGTCPAEPARVVYTTCWDGSQVESGTACPAQPQVTCWDGSIVSDAAFCPAQTTVRGNDLASLCANQYRQEIIYYEFDKGQSAETRNTIGRILDVGEYCSVDNIRVIGHTDTSGSAAYNLNLSQKRAKDARDELVRQGINSAIITSEGMGETAPFVPTGDGVKEQLNRRTEVMITLSEVGVIVN